MSTHCYMPNLKENRQKIKNETAYWQPHFLFTFLRTLPLAFALQWPSKAAEERHFRSPIASCYRNHKTGNRPGSFEVLRLLG